MKNFSTFPRATTIQALFAGALFALAIPSAALACDGTKSETMTTMSIEQAQKAKPAFVDANSATTRAKDGVIPGAVLLTSYDSYDATTELPSNKTASLVFYCANERCGASKIAAQRAMTAGYTNVAILPAGIQGWKKAGMKTDSITTKDKS
ncbi:MAG: rhodanese-like domain-containing protein [Deltaproteobacteria bacterium]|nr:rhodanese-like domain-containing protein [Deltaproteobacteria bacterium]